MSLDLTTPSGAHAAERLQRAIVIWLTTVRRDGQPQTSPVWFLWDGSTFLIYSRPQSQKLSNIAANSKVALNLDGDGQGGDIVTMEGIGDLLPDAPLATEVEAYVEKYRGLIAEIGYEPEPFAREYSSAIRVTPSRFRIY